MTPVKFGSDDKVVMVDEYTALLPVKLLSNSIVANPPKMSLVYRNLLGVNVDISELNIHSDYKLCIAIATKFAERGLTLMTTPAYLDKADKLLVVGHVGRDIIDINAGDHLFVCWLERRWKF